MAEAAAEGKRVVRTRRMPAVDKPMMWKDFVNVGFVRFGALTLTLSHLRRERDIDSLARAAASERAGVWVVLAHISHCWRPINRILGSFEKRLFSRWLLRPRLPVE